MLSAEPHIEGEGICRRPQRACRVDLDSGTVTGDWSFKPSSAATFSPNLCSVYFMPMYEPHSQHSDHCYLHLRNLDSGAVRRIYRSDEFDDTGAVNCAVSPDGSVLALIEYRRSGNVIRRLDLLTLTELEPIYEDAIWLAYSCDSRWLSAGGYGEQVWVWAETDRVGEWLEPVNALAWSPDGLLAWGKQDRLAVARPNAADALQTWDVGDIGHFVGLAFSPDGHRVLIGGYSGMCAIHDVVAGREIDAFDWKIGCVHSVAFSPDGLTCAAGGEKGQVVVWDVDV